LNVDFGFVDVLVCCSIAQLNKMHNMLVDLFGDVPPADEQSTPFAKLSKKWLLVLRNLSMITKITQTCLPFLAG
jgi:hypothetical protein